MRKIAERVSFTISVFILIAAFAFPVYQILRDDSDKAEFKVRYQLSDVARSGSAYTIPVEIENVGGRTASDVTISVKVTSNGESSSFDVKLDYVGGHAKEQFYVSSPDRPDTLDVRVLHFRNI